MNKRFLGLHIKSSLSYLKDIIRYEFIGSKPKNDVANLLPDRIEVKWTYDPKGKSFFAEAVDHKGIYSASDSIEGIIRNINVQIFEYYQIPQFYYRNMVNQYNPPIESLEGLKNGRIKNVKFLTNKYRPAYG